MQAFEIQPPAVTQCTSRPRPHFTSSFIGTRTAHLGRGPGPSQLAVRSRDRPPLELSTARRPRELPVPAAPSRGAPLAPDSAVPAPAAPAVPGPAAAAARSPPLPSVTAGGSPGARMGGTAAADPESACSLERPPLELSTSRRPGGSPGTRKGGMATAEPESGRLMDRTSGISPAGLGSVRPMLGPRTRGPRADAAAAWPPAARAAPEGCPRAARAERPLTPPLDPADSVRLPLGMRVSATAPCGA